MISFSKTSAGKKLESITGSGDVLEGKDLIKKFVLSERNILMQKANPQALIQAIEEPDSTIYRFAQLLLEDNNMDIFKKAIKLQARSIKTKRKGLFYSLIYKNIDKLPYSKSKIKAFLLAKNEGDIEDIDVDKKDKANKRMKHISIIDKLGSEKIQDVVKSFIGMVAWDYIKIYSENEKQKMKSSLLKPSKKTYLTKEGTEVAASGDIQMSKGLTETLRYLSTQQDNNPGTYILDPNTLDKAQKYFLDKSILEKSFRNLGDIEKVYCGSLGNINNEMRVGKTFTVDGYIRCLQNNSKLSFGGIVYSIENTKNSVIVADDNLNWIFIPPRTTFKVKDISEENREFRGINMPIKTIELEIVEQAMPSIPSKSNVSKMVDESYEESQKEQNRIWEELIASPEKYCLSGEKSPKEGDAPTPAIDKKASHYLEFLANLQKENLSLDEIKALDQYTAFYDRPKKMQDTIDGIFKKIEPLSTSITVFRGMDKDEFDALLQSYKKGRTFNKFQKYAKRGSRFLSTTVDPVMALGYMKGEAISEKGRGLLKLTIPAGFQAIAPETYNGHTTNSEIILQREGLEIEITNVTTKNGFSFIEAKVV